ncbi:MULTISPECIES: thiolase C-terminal domain-containing protein [Rhodococcus]|jgi:acetyl-CoA acetyltransferase|uniref:Transporter n=1 Tax=Rhodococcus jostii TaxID=132919 RepID=A0ABU4CIT6_RHOJO|nr:MULTISPECIES: transporter [Rhodococcus]MDI9949312.1 transporter [Rhodococcus sp. IEGM 1305]MDV6283476.1 transporter [Rhodococcus jostii]
MTDTFLRGAAAVVGASEFHYKRGESPASELRMTLRAIVEAAADAGVSPREIDGFVSYGGGDNDGTVVGASLMSPRIRWSTMIWGGGGGGAAAAITNAAVAIAAGQARCVVVYRAMAQKDSGRLGYAKHHFDGHMLPHGVGSPAQACALRTRRMLEHDGVPESAMKSLVLADYFHAQRNPHAAAFGRPLDEADYAASRMIVEPYRLYDCSRENDGAVALILVAAGRAEKLSSSPAYVLAGSQGAVGGYAVDSENDLDYTSAGFSGAAGVAETLWADADLGPDQVDVVQVYENFSGSGVAALIDHGLCPRGADAGKVMTLENLTAPHGLLPVNTSGGNLADSFVNGMGLAVEAVRQVRGTSTNQVPDAQVSLFIGGPMAALSSSVLLCTRDVL